MVPQLPDQGPTFEGFQHLDANYIYCPNQFFEVCLRHHSRVCVRLVAYMLRRTLGWLDSHGNPITQDISISYLDLQRNARISTRSIPAAIAQAERGGFVECVTPGAPNASGQRGQTGCYKLRWNEIGNYTDDPAFFQGFFVGEGHRSPIPNGYFDVVIPCETLALSKVVGTVLRHTVGYQNQFGGRRSDAALPYSYLQKFANIKDRNTLAETLKDGTQKGYIRCVSEGHFDPNAGRQSRAATYAVNWLPKAEHNRDTAKTLPDKLRDGKNPTEETAKTLLAQDGKNPTDKKTRLKNTLKQQHDVLPVAAEYLERFNLLKQVEFHGERFDERTALKLAQSRGLDEIKQQIAWLPKRKADRNPLGMLRSAIEQGWSAPIDVKERQRNRDAALKEKEAAAINTAQVAEVDRAKKELRRRREEALPEWNALPKDEQMMIEQAAFKRLDSQFHQVFGDN